MTKRLDRRAVAADSGEAPNIGVGLHGWELPAPRTAAALLRACSNQMRRERLLDEAVRNMGRKYHVTVWNGVARALAQFPDAWLWPQIRSEFARLSAEGR
jgi:hypothetical protein